jgi:hypothetical protein
MRARNLQIAVFKLLPLRAATQALNASTTEAT